MPLCDLSHTVEDGLVTYRGLPAPIVCDFLTREASREVYAPGTEFHIGKIEMVANTGTYVDSPFHRYPDGKDLSELPLQPLAGREAVVVNAPPAGAIGPDVLRGLDLGGRAVLFRTGWSRNWATDTYFEGHPFLTAHTAEALLEAGAAIVGIDSLNIDATDSGERPVHSLLLREEVPIVEHLTGLDALPATGARFYAVPVKVRAFGTFPVRAFAET
jgi:arylformamidase